MENSLLNSIELKQQEQSAENSIVKLLVFSTGKLTLALPVEQVKKVTKYTPIHGSGTSYVNLTHIGKQEITIIDLHQKLFGKSLDESALDGGYFVLTKSNLNCSDRDRSDSTRYNGEESIGIRVMETPILIDTTLADIRALPNSYRYADTLEIASHVAVIDRDTANPQTIFILDLEHLI